MLGVPLFVSPFGADVFHDLLVSLGTAVGGGALVWFGTWLQHRLTVNREDRTRQIESTERRIWHEREIIGELITAAYKWVAFVGNLTYGYDRVRQGTGQLDPERVRKYLDDKEQFDAALTRARVSIQNPAARPYLDVLHQTRGAVAPWLNQTVEGSPPPDSRERLEQLRLAVGEAVTELEAAALDWNGKTRSQALPSAVARGVAR